MPYLYGEYLTKHELMKKIGDISQIAGAKQYELTSGKAKGVQAIEIRNGHCLCRIQGYKYKLHIQDRYSFANVF